MFSLLDDSTRIYILCGYTDFRKGMDSLTQMAVEHGVEIQKNSRALFMSEKRLKSVSIDKRYNLEDLLKNIGDGFKEWRYIYEDDNEDFGYKRPFEYTEVFLEHYLEELSKMAHEKKAH